MSFKFLIGLAAVAAISTLSSAGADAQITLDQRLATYRIQLNRGEYVVLPGLDLVLGGGTFCERLDRLSLIATTIAQMGHPLDSSIRNGMRTLCDSSKELRDQTMILVEFRLTAAVLHLDPRLRLFLTHSSNASSRVMEVPASVRDVPECAPEGEQLHFLRAWELLAIDLYGMLEEVRLKIAYPSYRALHQDLELQIVCHDDRGRMAYYADTLLEFIGDAGIARGLAGCRIINRSTFNDHYDFISDLGFLGRAADRMDARDVAIAKCVSFRKSKLRDECYRAGKAGVFTRYNGQFPHPITRIRNSAGVEAIPVLDRIE